jgi:hypothetical protein
MEHRCCLPGEAGRPRAAGTGLAGRVRLTGHTGRATAGADTAPGHRRRGHGTGLPARQPLGGGQPPEQTKSAAALTRARRRGLLLRLVLELHERAACHGQPWQADAEVGASSPRSCLRPTRHRSPEPSVESEKLTGRSRALSGFGSRPLSPRLASRVEGLHTPPAVPRLPAAFRAQPVPPDEHGPPMATRTTA